MVIHDAPPLARPNAEWISRYAAGLLNSTPGLRPLDAVMRALDASAAASSEPPKHPAASSAIRAARSGAPAD